MDHLSIKGLEIFANHGVLKEENILGQKFLIDIEIYFDLKKAAQNDDISLSVNYAEVCQKTVDFFKENTFSLIETASLKTGEMIMTSFPLIEKLDIEVKKPWAPIGFSVEYVSSSLSLEKHTAYLSIGSNMGDKKGYLDFAVKSISENKMCETVKVSDYITTSPVGYTEQDDFLNAALCIKTLYSPQELLKFVNKIETEAHRERKIHWGPRTLDIDIIYYDNIVINEENLIIPHKEAKNREKCSRDENLGCINRRTHKSIFFYGGLLL